MTSSELAHPGYVHATYETPDRMCCHLHSHTCAPPSELCCEHCTEKNHPEHPTGTRCVLAISEQHQITAIKTRRASIGELLLPNPQGPRGEAVAQFLKYAPTDIDWLVAKVEQQARFATLLARLEWPIPLLGAALGPGVHCPICNNVREQGHEPDCWLGAELDRIRRWR
jgi:hypothetical protein